MRLPLRSVVSGLSLIELLLLLAVLGMLASLVVPALLH